MIQNRRDKWLVRSLVTLMPFSVGMRLIQLLAMAYARSPLLGRRARRTLALTRDFVEPRLDRSVILRRHLLANGPNRVLYTWRRLAVGFAAGAPARRWVTFRGLDHLESARSSGRGTIIVSSHFGGGSIVPSILPGWLGIQVTSLHAEDGYTQLGMSPPDGLFPVELKRSFLPQVLLDMIRRLKRGEVVHLAADGYIGRGGLQRTFCGKERTFQPGFADMAVQSGANVVPVFAPFREDGRIEVTFHEPIVPGPESVPRKERIAGLVGAYADLLQQMWLADPGNILAGHLRRHSGLDSPESADSGDEAAERSLSTANTPPGGEAA